MEETVEHFYATYVTSVVSTALPWAIVPHLCGATTQGIAMDTLPPSLQVAAHR